MFENFSKSLIVDGIFCICDLEDLNQWFSMEKHMKRSGKSQSPGFFSIFDRTKFYTSWDYFQEKPP
ncbi:hypothetical protein D0X99_14165 [Algoriphagus lacus]|uniref:Uncharacterized protein n=1 Tax=Algoriphagus lacus TaxID=2056311 RepID=A0A418PPF2_9BACT|nr:hypothetical protein D0X99_14165 [Algoriphagus lacus]